MLGFIRTGAAVLAALIAVLVFLAPTSAWAWSTKEHVIITRSAVRQLLASDQTPPDMKRWLISAQPSLGTDDDELSFLMNARMGVYPRSVDGLAFWSVMPDLIADSAAGKERKVQPFGVSEGTLHFIDLEFFNPDPARQRFAQDLSGRPKFQDISRDMNDARWQKAGMLPFRIENCLSELTKAIKAGRLVDQPGQFPRDEHATKWAGMLAHYAADNCMPMHATADYQAYSFFPNLPQKPKVHFDMEFRLTDDEKADYPELRAAFWRHYVDAAKANATPALPAAGDAWERSVQISLNSYEALPMIGQAARTAYLDPSGNLKAFDAGQFFGFEGELQGKRMTILELKARQMALAARWTAQLWLEAWDSARSATTAPATRQSAQ